MNFLKDNGIGTALHYPNILPMLECYKHLNHSSYDFPNGYDASQKILSLPMFPQMEKEEIQYVCQKIKEAKHGEEFNNCTTTQKIRCRSCSF